MKISKNDLQIKSNNLKNLIKGVVEDTVKVPDNALIFLNYEDLLEIFTKKRLELIKLINRVKPKSLQQLADLTNRKKQAVNRDLKILERHEVLKLEKEGRNVIPKINKKLILFPLTSKISINEIENTVENGQKQEPMLAEIYVNGENINQKLVVGGW